MKDILELLKIQTLSDWVVITLAFIVVCSFMWNKGLEDLATWIHNRIFKKRKEKQDAQDKIIRDLNNFLIQENSDMGKWDWRNRMENAVLTVKSQNDGLVSKVEEIEDRLDNICKECPNSDERKKAV